MYLVNISFLEILDIWKTKLWFDRKSAIKHISSMVYLGGYDMSIYNNKPTFFALKNHNQIVAVNSGHMTNNGYYRSRGLWVEEQYRNNGLTYVLFNALSKQALLENAKYIWSYPNKKSVGVYIKNKFSISSSVVDNELGPHYYVIRAATVHS